MGTKYENYEKSLETLNMQKLSERRTNLSLTFAKRTLMNKKNEIYVPEKNRKEEPKEKKD